MTDQLIYRLNRVPGPELRQVPRADRGAPLPADRGADAGHVLAAPRPSPTSSGSRPARRSRPSGPRPTRRSSSRRPRTCRSSRRALAELGSMVDGKAYRDHWAALEKGDGFICFEDVAGSRRRALRRPVGGGAVERGPAPLQLRHRGRRRRPDDPPLVWEAWNGEDWEPCELDSDTTGGLNRDGDVVIHVPRSHARPLIAKHERAGCGRGSRSRSRASRPTARRRASPASPRSRSAGRPTPSTPSSCSDEEVGTSEGVPGQRFLLKRQPVVPIGRAGGPRGLGRGRLGGVDRRSPDFAGSGPDDHHFVLDLSSGEVRLGPGGPAGRTARSASYGAVPDKGARLRMRAYRTGGGRQGQRLGRRADRPEVVDPVRRPGREPAPAPRRGRRRGHRERQDPGPDPAPHPRPGGDDRGLRAPRSRGGAGGRPDPEPSRPATGPMPAPSACSSSRRRAHRRAGSDSTSWCRATRRSRRSPSASRSPGSSGRGQSSSRRSTAGSRSSRSCERRPRQNPTRLQEEALRALYAYFDPIAGGPEGTGWPFGRPVNVGEVYSVLQGLRGTEVVEDARLFGADPVTGQRGQQTTAPRARAARTRLQLRAPGPGRGR